MSAAPRGCRSRDTKSASNAEADKLGTGRNSWARRAELQHIWLRNACHDSSNPQTRRDSPCDTGCLPAIPQAATQISTNMDCKDCIALLDDLLRGGLPARREAAVRSHLATCQTCRAEHMRRLRITELNTAFAPPPLRKRLAWPRRLWTWRSPLPPAPVSNGGPARLGLLGRLPMVPQVATGTVMLLIVLVGLWSLPQLTRRHAAPNFEDRAAGEAIRRVKPATNSEPGVEKAAETSTNAARLDSAALPPPTAADANPPHAPANAESSHDLEAGISYYRARDYAQATPLLSRALVGSSTSSEQATTLLYLARAERALGHCDRAVNSYSTLVRVHSTKTEASAALREGVACYDDMAEPGHAQHLLEQAAGTRSLAADARSLLAQRSGASGHKSTHPRASRATPLAPADSPLHGR
jgi:anti-sigma factor RsiW